MSRSKFESSLGVIRTIARRQEAPSEVRSCFGNDRRPYHRVRTSFILASPLIIISCRFGGGIDGHYYNDTWSFDISTRKWTELQCTGSIPSPRSGHAAVLVDDVMYVFGGSAIGGTYLGDLIAFNLSSKWFGMFSLMCSFKYNIQLSDGPHFKTSDQVQAEGGIMPWLLTGLESLCSEENYLQKHR